MTNLATLRQDFQAAESNYLKILSVNFPGASRWDWHRAVAAARGENVRWNDDTSRDDALAADADIRAAYDEYIRRLHVFYRARDGEHGFLGGRGG